VSRFPAHGPSDMELDRSVVVASLFHDGVVIDYFVLVPAFLGHEIVSNGNDGAGHDESYDFLGFGFGHATRSGPRLAEA
jgi:hypothetical protein